MEARQIGWIVTWCLVGGLIVAAALVLGPVAGAQEHVITGTILLAFAASWALVATLSVRWTDEPQRWASAPAAFMALAGAALLVFAPNGEVMDALGWVWPPFFLALLAWNCRPCPSQSAQPCTRVLLESALGETGGYWGWIWPAIADETRVCVYDRAGRGWSDPASLPQDGVAVATDLHTLMDHAQVPGPFVLVGHSSGAQYVRIFAGRYPEQVAGMVLLRIYAVLPTLARFGVGRVLVQADLALPAAARDVQRVHHASARLYRSLRDEFEELPTTLAQARSVRNLGDRPLVVVTAAQDSQAGWLPLQDRLARLSTNTSHRVVSSTHIALVTDQTAAQTSIQAIRDVVHAVRSNAALDKSF